MSLPMTTTTITSFTPTSVLKDPLEALPPELVGDIFRCWLLSELYPHPECSDSQYPVTLCRVSKAWKNFVYASPLLWAHVIIRVSQNSVPSAQVLRERLARSQNAPLFVEAVIEEQPDKEVLRVLFGQCSRFRELTLAVQDLSWWNDMSMKPFTKLRKLCVRTWTRPGILVKEDELGDIFTSAPLLRHVHWHSTADPGPISISGSRLHHLDLVAFRVPVTRVLDILAACPNLRTVTVSFMDENPVPPPLKERITMGALESLELCGSKHLTCLMDSIRAPLLAKFDIHWARCNRGTCGAQSLQSFLDYSTRLQELILNEFLTTEDGLISMISRHTHLTRLVVIAEPERKNLITNKTFEVLTRRQEHRTDALPRLVELVLRGGVSVEDEVLCKMIESRARLSPPSSCPTSSRGPGEFAALKAICLDRCKATTYETIDRVQSLCQRGGIKVEGSFMCRNRDWFYGGWY
ncbi:hypothetical protein F5I97DRAFT_979152 [Phlebopus sp. FC_14]|nr:hypothetical protein F5I97DRAFT_979152 [Phlebopus sp. FC_14]